MNGARIDALRGLLEERALDAILLSRAASTRFYSGFRLGDAEGPTSGFSGTLLVTGDANLILADSRYTEQARAEAPAWQLIETSRSFAEELPPLLAEHRVVRLGLEAAVVSHADWAGLAAAAPGVELHAVDEELMPLRIRKSPEEVEAIGRACALTDACFDHLVEWIRPGMTEQEIAWELEAYFRRGGAEGLAFEPIVLVGPRASMPHGRPSATTVEAGNVLLIDFGCIVDGYRSDMTRTLLVGEVPDDVRRYHEAVRDAQAVAIEAIRPGINGQELDALARRRIEREGVAPYGHGLGHGIGLETHEPPRLRKTEAFTLEPGMVFSVEPGIYLPGITGIRIEDIVALEADGPRLLTSSPREPIVLGA